VYPDAEANHHTSKNGTNGISETDLILDPQHAVSFIWNSHLAGKASTLVLLVRSMYAPKY
jgi:hypothetical protein